MQKKTINIVLFYPIKSAAGNRVLAYINVLKNKYNINLILSKKDNIDISNINIYHLNNTKIEKQNFFKRVISEVFISYKLLKLSKKFNSDISFITIPSMFLLPIFCMDRRKKIVDVRDIVWKYLNNRVIKYILTVIMTNSFKCYDKVIVTNNAEKKILNRFNPIVIPNGISIKRFNILSKINIEQQDIFTITYIGNIGVAQNLMQLCKIAKDIPDINIKLIGDGNQYKEIKEYIKANNINNIKLMGKLEWDDLLKEYSTSSILFARLDESFNSAIPSKLYEYLSTGLPILYIGSGAAKELLKQFENTFVIDNRNENVNNFKNYINKLKEKKFDKSYKNIEIIRKYYIRENNSKKIIDIIEKL